MKRIVLLAACLALLMGSARASIAVRMEDGAALLHEDGAEIVPQGVYEDILPLGDERFAAVDGECYALLDGQGEPLTEPVYDELRLTDGVLIGRKSSGWGLLSRDGEELGSFTYSAILPAGEGACWALRDEEELRAIYLLDSSGAARDSGLRARRVGEPGEGLLPMMAEDDRWGYCDASGHMAIPAHYDWAGCFASGCAVVVDGGQYGAIDRDGEWIVEPEWDYLEICPGGFLLLAGEDGARVLNPDGNILAEYPGEDVWVARASEGYLVGDANSLRAFDASGNLLETLAPDASVSEGVGDQLVISEGMWGEECVRLSGTEQAYQNLYPLGTAGDGAVYASLSARSARYQSDLLDEVQVSVDMDSARYGLVDGAGNVLVPCVYLSVQYLADDRFLVQDARQYRVINSWGKVYWRSNGAMRIAAPNS